MPCFPNLFSVAICSSYFFYSLIFFTISGSSTDFTPFAVFLRIRLTLMKALTLCKATARPCFFRFLAFRVRLKSRTSPLANYDYCLAKRRAFRERALTLGRDLSYTRATVYLTFFNPWATSGILWSVFNSSPTISRTIDRALLASLEVESSQVDQVAWSTGE